jgi:type I site-specific restriction endonuclease
MKNGKTLVIKSRYGSGKTTFLQKLIKDYDMTRVLFITYRQTLARDIMRNFKKLGFKNYLDSYENPDVWNSPKLIVQLDSLMNVVLKNTKYKEDERFDPKYDLIVLDESESLLNHFDEGTMEGKDIQVFDFFDQLLEHSKKVAMLDGDISKRSLSFAKHYGQITYVKNKNNG